MRVLFVTASRVGDAVLSTGIAAHLLAAHPEAVFTVACGPAAEGVFLRMPRREATIVVEKRRYDLHWWDLWRRVAGVRWDLVVDVRGSALAWLVRARRRAVMRGGRRPGHRITHLAGVLGVLPAPMPVVWTHAADRAAAAAVLPEGTAWVGLGPTANWDGKVWPAERFVAVFEAIGALMPGARAVVFGGSGEGERRLAAPVLAGLPDAVDLAGKLTLAEAAACLARCRVFVGNDSGLMHLAAAAGVPTVGLFGPSLASEYGPQGRVAAAVVADGAPGRGRMLDLPVERVVAAAGAMLA